MVNFLSIQELRPDDFYLEGYLSLTSGWFGHLLALVDARILVS